ncbi:MAG TPA: ABC transporter permease [Vicinamibacterales bacterium]|jgi:putative ABC transport system permease protein|nr:ABC transporter permease [Vicinamibacterales bacterium]
MPTDLRHALRALRHAPGFSTVAILTLALGIGANTALFSVADAVLLRPLPYPDSDRLVAVEEASSLANWRGDVRRDVEESAVFAGVGTYVAGAVNVGGDPAPERVRAAAVSAGFFKALAPQPIAGRVFTADDLKVDPRQAVVSHAFWTRRGRSLRPGGELLINGRTFVIAGIMPPRVDFPGGVDVWIPTGSDNQIAGNAAAPAAIARLASGVTPDRARLEIERIAAAAAKGRRDANAPPVVVVPLRDQLVGPVRPVFVTLAIAVALVLLVACLNVASLLLARVSAREREIAARRALGATGLKLVRLLLCESALLSAGAGLLAVPVAVWTLAAIRVVLPAAPVGADAVAIDARAFLATAVLCVTATCIFSLAPVWSLRRASAASILRTTSSSTSDPFWRRFRSALVVAELAIALVLIAGAATIARTVGTLMRVDLGVSGERALTVETTLPLARYGSLERLDVFYERMEAAVRRIPGVETVGTTSRLPGTRELGIARPIMVEGRPAPEGAQRGASYLSASPDYFQAIGIPLVAGRHFASTDRAGAQPVAMISESVARRVGLSPTEAIGQRIAIGLQGRSLATIVGVVRDVRLQGPEADPGAQLYVPLAQQANYGTTFIVVKTLGNPTTAAPALRAAIARVDVDLPIYNIQTFAQVRASFLADRAFAMAVLSAFGALAFLLAGIGLYGTLTYLVQLRTPEIGIRMALGASPGAVRRQILRQGLLHAVAAIALGAGASAMLLRVMTSVVPGLQRPEMSMLAAAAGTMLIAVIPIIWLPARRATAIDPVHALRTE